MDLAVPYGKAQDTRRWHRVFYDWAHEVVGHQRIHELRGNGKSSLAHIRRFIRKVTTSAMKVKALTYLVRSVSKNLLSQKHGC